MSYRAVLVVALVLLAGCSSSLDGAPAVGGGGEGGDGPTWTGDADNPYQQRELVVAVAAPTNGSRAFAPLVREALSYWEASSERYAGYPIEYRLAPDAADPDVRVRFVDAVGECGTEDGAAGCAPVVTEPGQFDPPVTVRVRGGFSDESTVGVLKHEFGHTLGLAHGDPPDDVMRPVSTLTTLPQTNATAKALPWDDSTLSVHVDLSAVPAGEREAARRQVDAALGYFADGAGGTVPENVSFVRTDDRAAADVTVRATDDSPCSTSSGSCGYLRGSDPDGDGARETYTRLEITVTDLDTAAVAWHVGRWLGTGFGVEGDDYPEPLRESTSYAERRSEWWR